MRFEFKKKTKSWLTYSELQGLGVLVLDWFCLLVIPGSDWDG